VKGPKVAEVEFDPTAVTDEVSEGIGKIREASDLEELKALRSRYSGADSAMNM